MKKNRNFFLKHIGAHKHSFGAITIAILMTLVVFTGLFIVWTPERVHATSTSDFEYYKNFTIDYRYVDAKLDNFPIFVNDSTGDLSECLANGSDIAFFASDGVTQLNHEVESFNDGTDVLYAWVNVTDISAVVNTTFFMYYGDSDGGYSVGYNPESVWDSNYTGVYHMNETTGTICHDSTSNNHHGTYIGGNMPTQNNTIVGPSQYFDGSGDYINLSAHAWSGGTATYEMWVQEEDVSTTHIYYATKQDYNDFSNFMGYAGNNDINWNHKCAGSYDWDEADDNTRNANLHYMVHQFDGSASQFWTDDASVDTDVGTSCTHTINTFHIGLDTEDQADFIGTMDEFRVSSTKRANAWLNVSFDTQNETTGFITTGAETASDTTTFTILGLEGTLKNITWSGNYSETVWSNASTTNGDGGTLEYNMTINASVNITDILVYISNIDTSIPASNVTLYISSDNISYGSMGVFDGTANISINTTTWPVGGGTNPFTVGEGLTDKTTSIYMRFKCVFGDVEGTFTQDDWYIRQGYYV